MNAANDRYVRVVLTVIAACLVLVAVEGLPFSRAQAAPPGEEPSPQKVQVVGPVDVRFPREPVEVKFPPKEPPEFILVGIGSKWAWRQEIPVRVTTPK